MKSKSLKTCRRCTLDETVSGIFFDKQGVCNYCYIHDRMARQFPLNRATDQKLKDIIRQMKAAGKGKRYDCVVGLSGGTDSSFCLYLTKKWHLRPLVVHLDNGWNSELAVANIEKICRHLKVDLETIVLDWEEFKNLQRAFLKASVPDLEVTTDFAIRATLFHVAQQEKIGYIINGQNFRTEGKIPLLWAYADDKYIQSIYSRFGKYKKFKTFPNYTLWQQFYYTFVKKIKSVQVLQYIDYHKEEAQKILKKEFDWQEYGGKHHESTITKFLQTYILPRKFGIDKRKIHLAALVRSGQMSRVKALRELQKPFFETEHQARQEAEYVAKKLDFAPKEFAQIMTAPPKTFLDYPNRYRFFKTFNKIIQFVFRIFHLPVPIIFHTMELEEKNQALKSSLFTWTRLKNILSLVIVVGLIAFAIWYIRYHLTDFQIIRQISFNQWSMILTLVLINYFSIGLTLKTVMQPFGVRLGFKEWMGLTMITSMGNLFVPSGGLGFRAVYLKKVHHFDYTHFLSTFAVLSIIDIILFGLIGLVSLFFVFGQTMTFNWPLAIFFLIIILLCLGALIFSPVLPNWQNKFLARIVNVFKSWAQLKVHPGLISRLFLLTTLNLISSVFIYFLAFRALGLNISWPQAMLPAALGDYGGYLRILPAAAGFFEGAVIYSSQVLGATTTQGLIVAEIIRVTGIVWAVILGLIFSLILIKPKKP